MRLELSGVLHHDVEEQLNTQILQDVGCARARTGIRFLHFQGEKGERRGEVQSDIKDQESRCVIRFLSSFLKYLSMFL